MAELSSRSYVRELLRTHGLHLSRQRGQNFLVDPNHLEKIREAANLGPSDRVLEVGAGFGTLTELLAEEAGWVVSIELDEGVFRVLQDHLGERSNVRLVLGDALELDLVKLLDELPQQDSTCVGWHAPKVVANLPYNITSPILAQLLQDIHPVRPLERIVVMVQKEVAERIAGEPGTKNYSSFTVLTQYYARPEIYSIVPAGCFFPTPKVDSAILVLHMRSRPAVHVDDEELFFRVVRAAFALRRKTLANALSANPQLGLDKQQMKEALNEAGIDPRTRGEKLSLEQFAEVTRMIQKRQAEGTDH